MGLRLCQLCGFAWDNHGTLCPGSFRVFPKTPAADPRDARIAALEAEVARLNALVNRPGIGAFMDAVKTEAAHQKERWGPDHDEGKTPDDWLWALAFLATKATQAQRYGDVDKYLHHIVTSGALCANWFEQVKRRAALSPKET
jgi:hypothetical protein